MSVEKPDLFDPETGKPLKTAEKQEEKKPDLFDPETGKPLAQKENKPDLFDPETGKPLAQGENKPALFDPETGEPLKQAAEQPDLFDPETGRLISGSGKMPVSPKSKRPLIIGAAAAGICAAAAIAAIAGGGLFKSQKDIVADAVTEIVKTADDGFLEDTFGIKELRKLAAEGSVHTGVSVELDELPMLGTLGSGSGSIEFSRDVGSNAVLLNGSAELANMELGNVMLYMDDKKIAAAMPEFLDQVFTLNYGAELDKQIDDSYLAEFIGMEEEDAEFAAALMADANQMLAGKKKRFDLAEIYDRYKETTKAADNLKNALEIEKADKKTFKVDGKDQKCKGYKVGVPKKAIAEFAKAAGKFIVSDEQIKENEIAYITDLLTAGRMISGSHYDDARDWAEAQTDELIDMLKAGGDEVEDFVKDYMDDLELVLYVDKKGHAVYLAVETSVNAYQVYDIEAEFTLAGGAVPTKSLDGSIDITSKGDSLRLDIEKTEKTTNDRWTSETEIKCTTAYDSVKLTLSTDYNRKSGDFEAEAGVSSGSMRVSAGLEGGVTDYKKGKSLTVEVDSINLKGPFASFKGLSGGFFIEPLSSSLKAPEGEAFDIVAADRADWEEVGKELYSQIEDVSRTLNGY